MEWTQSGSTTASNTSSCSAVATVAAVAGVAVAAAGRRCCDCSCCLHCCPARRCQPWWLWCMRTMTRTTTTTRMRTRTRMWTWLWTSTGRGQSGGRRRRHPRRDTTEDVQESIKPTAVGVCGVMLGGSSAVCVCALCMACSECGRPADCGGLWLSRLRLRPSRASSDVVRASLL